MKTVKIKAPNGDFTGKRGGVAFVDGIGETDDPTMVAYFRRHGYGVAGEEPAEPVREPDEPPAGERTAGPAKSEGSKPAAKKTAPKKPTKKAAGKPAAN